MLARGNIKIQILNLVKLYGKIKLKYFFQIKKVLFFNQIKTKIYVLFSFNYKIEMKKNLCVNNGCTFFSN